MIGCWILDAVCFVKQKAASFKTWLYPLSTSQTRTVGGNHQLAATSQPSSRHLTILDLPTETKLQVLSYLTVTSRACVALTCTRLYHQFSDVLQSEEFRYPAPSSGRHRHESIRTELLLRLETQFWLFCDACLMLHPRSEFFEDDLELKAPRICKWPGVIQLCRCLRFTPGRLIRLREQLQLALTTNSMGPHIMNSIPNWHRCQESDNCWLSVTLALDESLRVVFRLCFTMTFDLSEPHANQSIFICRHGWNDLKSIRAHDNHCASCMAQAVLADDAECRSCQIIRGTTLYTCEACHDCLNLDFDTREADGRLEFTVSFDRVYTVPYREPPGPWALTQADYDWTIPGIRQ
ncbi:hypothetical protein N7541_001077 [Penicillium brevicompactum]|uniref:F-box domain-containing protein n=1 Tax=Penicillium brevicompactum TaxID=5074 RepID=A0A9W9V5L8_PENBR|nr:hypothetical protein N7541_001077 [Penicillium brevicompactum]